MAATRLQSLPAPVSEPPFDDEPGIRQHPASPMQGTLALQFDLPSGLPAEPQPGLRLLPGGAAEANQEFGAVPTSRAELPDPRWWAARIVQAVLEVVAGNRPIAQLVRWLDGEIYHDVQRRVVVLARVRSAARHGDREAASRAARSGAQGARVCSVRVCEPADGIAEACATVRRDGRTVAVALRLEGLDGRWRCTALELG